MNDYYVYLHRKKTDNTIFYVGKGREYRAWSTVGRSKAWRQVADSCERSVEIVARDLEESVALAMERRLILQYRQQGCPLVNASRHEWLSVSADIDYYWKHKSGLIVRGTPMAMIEAYGGSVDGWGKLLNQINSVYRGWSNPPSNPYICPCTVGTPIPKTMEDLRRITNYQERFL